MADQASERDVAAASGITRRVSLAAGASGLAAALLAGCSFGDSKGDDSSNQNVFKGSGKPRFVFVNHVTTNPFFVTARSGADDACKLLGCSYQWTGSKTSNVNEMVNALNAAITGGADGIAIALTDPKAFNQPVAAALKAKIPVVSYNADAKNNERLSYIGQDLFASGQEMARRIVSSVGSGDVALFIATPGTSDLQPRLDGVKDVLKQHPQIKAHVIATGPAVPAQLSVIDAYAASHPNTKGYFAVDSGSTQGLAQVLQKRNLRAKGVKGGGYDLNPATQKLLGQDQIDFSIDQQPYLQGFLPILQLFLYRVSNTVTGIGDVNTGLKFVDRAAVGPYPRERRYG